MEAERGKPEDEGAGERGAAVSLKDALRRVRAARQALGAAEAAFDEARARNAAARSASRAAGNDAPRARAPTLDELDWPEPLTDEEAERVFLGSALRRVEGLQAKADALRERMAAEGGRENDVWEALLALARDHVFPEDGPEEPNRLAAPCGRRVAPKPGNAAWMRTTSSTTSSDMEPPTSRMKTAAKVAKPLASMRSARLSADLRWNSPFGSAHSSSAARAIGWCS